MSRGIIIGENVELTDVLGIEPKRQHVDNGTAVKVLETWLRVRADDAEGFVSADHLRLEGTPATDDSPASAAPTSEPEILPVTGIAASDAIFDIKVFRGSRITSEKPIECDTDFHPALERLDQYAARADVYVFVTQSLRFKDRQPSGAIVPPAKRSNHLVGHAIDMNLYMGNKNPWFNSTKLSRKKLSSQPQAVRGFIDMVRNDDTLRWGGDFVKEDPVHIDDNLYGRAPDVWMKKFEAIGSIV